MPICGTIGARHAPFWRRFRLAFFLLLACALGPGAALVGKAQAAPRAITPLPDGWRFYQGDPQGAESPTLDDSGWRPVSVPHDWAIAGPFDKDAKAAGENGFLPSGVAWYRRALPLAPTPGRR